MTEPWNAYSRLVRPRAPSFGAAIVAIGSRKAAMVLRMETFIVAVCASALSCALGGSFGSMLMIEDDGGLKLWLSFHFIFERAPSLCRRLFSPSDV